MKVSLLIGNEPNSLSMKRYTASTSQDGTLQLVEFDELERADPGHQWRKVRTWSVSQSQQSVGQRYDGVEIVDRPGVPISVRRGLIDNARKCLIWGFKE